MGTAVSPISGVQIL